MSLFDLPSHVVLDPQALRRARLARNWSQTKLSERAGVAKAMISRLERQRRKRPGFAIILALSEALYCGLSGRVFKDNPITCATPGCGADLEWQRFRLATKMDENGNFQMVPSALCRCPACGAEVDLPEETLRR